MEIIKKDLKRQQQKEKQARSQSSLSRKDQTKIKSSQGTQKPIPLNRERNDSDDVIQQHNRFGSLSDSSDDMELGEAPDRPQTKNNRSRSSEHTRASSSNNRSKSSITYPKFLVQLKTIHSKMNSNHRTIQWNCRGLRSNYNDILLLLSLLSPLDFCLQETFF